MLIGDILEVWRKGKSVANPTGWKNIGITAGAISGLLSAALAVARGFGYDVGVNDSVIEALATGVAGVLCLVTTGLHVTTSEKVGLPSKADADAGRGESAVGEIGSGPDYRG